MFLVFSTLTRGNKDDRGGVQANNKWLPGPKTGAVATVCVDILGAQSLAVGKVFSGGFQTVCEHL